jgi:allantoinase
VPYDLVIHAANRDVAIADGAIAAFESGPARAEIDARDLHLLPGVIDAHVHFNEPGRTDWEGWATGTRALAAGGATACIEMPLNAHPPTIDGPAFDAKRQAAERSAVVDFALWGGIVPGNLDRLEELAERGVVGFKAFMCDSGIEDFPAADPDTLAAGMERAAALNLPVAVHAEDPATLRSPHGTDWRAFVDSRPVEAELRAIERALELAKQTGCSLHVVHVSSARGVALVKDAGIDATCETCPHYLTLTDEDLEHLGTRAKCAPPLRSPAERDQLWEAIGDIALIASDHSPCPPEMKRGVFTAAWGGIAGCQTLLPLLLDSQRLDLEQVATLTSTNPAHRFRLPKGMQIGADADLVLVDLNDRHAPALHDRHQLSPFAGRPLRGRVVRTFLRGETVFHDGEITPQPGRLLTPTKGAT